MKHIGDFLNKNGYNVDYAAYPSRKNTIEEISANWIKPLLQNPCSQKAKKIHFVTHSMGGIIVRYFLQENRVKNLGRVVMLAPPSQGSEVADFLSHSLFLKAKLGPALLQLKADPSSFVNTLGLPNFEFAIIAGNASIDPVSSLILPGDDDGKVTIARSRLKNSSDFLLVEENHTFIMDAPAVQQATLRFLKNGKFQ